MAQSEPPNAKGGSFVSQLGLFAKKERHAEGLSPIGTQCGPMGLNAMYGERLWRQIAASIGVYVV